VIEMTTVSTVVQELPVPDPEFRVEPQPELQLIVPSSLEVFCENDATDVQWTTPELPFESEPTRRVLDQIVSDSKRESERHPRSARSRVNYGVALLNAGHLDAATNQFEMARELDPQNISVLAHLARVRLLEQRVQEARELANQVRKLDSSNVLGALLVASAEIAEGRPVAATKALMDAARLAPENWVPEYLLGLVLIGQRQPRNAIAHLRSASRSQPRSAAVRHALGVAFGLQAEWGKAVRAFREALALAPRRRESVLALAHVLLRRDAADDAIGILSDWVAIAPYDREVQELLAHSYRVTNNYRAARRHLQVALQLMPDDEENAASRARVLNNIGVCTGYSGDHVEAADWYSRSIRAMPTMTAFRNLARAYRAVGKLESALAVLATALTQNPDDSDARLLSSVTSAEVGHADEAIEMLKKLIDDGNAVAQAYACLGWVLSDEKRDYDAALDILFRGYELFPFDTVIANNLAYVNLMVGNLGAAKAILLKVPASEIQESVYLTATEGLLRLCEGDVQDAATFYKAAEVLARHRGQTSLARAVRQKMHLEFARAYLRMQNRSSAEKHVKRGLAIHGRPSYHEDLLKLKTHLLQA
jgi:tetratricopeptide (TPR) repeat protein